MGKESFVVGRDGRVLDRLGIADLIDRLTDRDIAVVATHHVTFGLRVADRLEVPADGRIDSRGDSLSPSVAEEYGLRTFAFERP